MIKYVIQIDESDEFGGLNTSIKKIKKSKFKLYEKKGWRLVRKEYFIITYFSDWWRSLNTNHKISIIGIIVASIVAIIIDNSGC